VDTERLAARLWPGRAVELEPLGGGITNHNFKVTLDGETLVLRIGGKDTDLLGIDRYAEHAASVSASRLGVGPDVVAFVEPEGFLLTRFIDGRAIAPEEMPVADVGRTLRLVHSGSPIPARFDAFRVVENYRRIAEEHDVGIPAAYADAKSRADEIEATLGPRPLCPCHNDLLNGNFIHDGQRLRIVDWEYAGMGDPLFDLANFAVNHELGEAGEAELLQAYAGDARPETLALLRRMRFMSDFREAMWGVVQQGISDLDFDFGSYADEHFERALSALR
jgi:thiamine kinase-like enzyme